MTTVELEGKIEVHDNLNFLTARIVIVPQESGLGNMMNAFSWGKKKEEPAKKDNNEIEFKFFKRISPSEKMFFAEGA